MKFAALLLLIFNVIAALAVAAFLSKYSLVTTPAGEFLFLEARQANECRIGGECAVFSQREWLQSLQAFVMQRGGRL
jgi:hypothetical protein